jgi:hypothetical protein
MEDRIDEFVRVANSLGIALHENDLTPVEQVVPEAIAGYNSLPSEQRKKFTLEQTIKQLQFAYRTNEFTRRWFDANDFDPYSIESYEDLLKMPVSDKLVITRNTTHGLDIITDQLLRLWTSKGLSKENLPPIISINAPQLRNFYPTWTHWTGGTSRPKNVCDHLLVTRTKADAALAVSQLAEAAPHIVREGFPNIGFSLYADHIAHDVLARDYAEDMRDSWILPRISGQGSDRIGEVMLRIADKLDPENIYGMAAVFPPASSATKSGGLSGWDLYRSNPRLWERVVVNLHSSTGIPNELLKEFYRHQATTMDAAGCNEVLPPWMDGLGHDNGFFREGYFRNFELPALTQAIVPNDEGGWRYARSGELALLTLTRIASLIDITTQEDIDLENAVYSLHAYYQQEGRLPQIDGAVDFNLIRQRKHIESRLLSRESLTPNILKNLYEYASQGGFRHFAYGPNLSSQFINYTPGLIGRIEQEPEAPMFIKKSFRKVSPDSLIYNGLVTTLSPQGLSYSKIGSTDGGCGEVPK